MRADLNADLAIGRARRRRDLRRVLRRAAIQLPQLAPALSSSEPDLRCDAFDWVVVVAYLGWIVCDGLRRTERHRQGRRLLPRQPHAAVVGGRPVGDGDAAERRHDGRHDRPGLRRRLRFLQFYFGLPLAMVILSLTVVPFFTRASVYTAYEYLERRFDVRTRSLTSFLFLLGRALVARRDARGAGGRDVGDPRLDAAGHGACDRRADDRLHDVRRRAGGGLDRRQADVHRRRRHVGGGRRSCSTASCSTCGFGQALHLAGATGRLQAFDFRFDLTRDLHVLVGHDRRAVPDAVVLRLRPEPGAALSHGEVDRRGAPVAADERLLEDPAAGADSADRRAGVRVLPVSARRRCCSTAPTTRRSRPSPQAAEYAALQQRVRRRDRRPRGRAAERDDRDAFLASDARVKDIRAQAVGVVKRGDRRRALQRRQLRLSDVHHDAACRSAWSG